MKCPNCGHAISDKDLGCRGCIRAKALRGALEAQHGYVPDAIAARIDLHIARPGRNLAWHLMLFGYTSEPFCGQAFTVGQKDRRTYAALVKAIEDNRTFSGGVFCQNCIDAFVSYAAVEEEADPAPTEAS